jgi:DNA-binding LacI/PurR family transcriptional regulator
MKDVAKMANVSLSTVSYALNGTRPISEETRKRISEAMEELDYRPHPLARGLASKHSRILAILFPVIERGIGITEFEFINSAAHAASKNGYHLVVWSAETNDPGELKELTQQGLVDGVILMEVHINDSRVNLLRESGFPFSMIGRCDDDRDGYVDIDFEKTMKLALEHLSNFGHHQIAFINQSRSTFDAGYGPVVRTKKAFEDLINQSGLKGEMRFCKPTPQAGFDICNDVFTEKPETSAIIIMNDQALPGIIHAISSRGLKIPKDVSVVAMVSSVRMAEMMVPKLTTFEPPSAELGQMATELLIEHLEGNGSDNPRILIPCHLIMGESTGPFDKSRND